MTDKKGKSLSDEYLGLLGEAILELDEEENREKVLANNPFASQWQLDDPKWVKKRKKNWKHIKENLIKEGKRTKILKHFKAFYVEGLEPCEARGADIYDIGFTAYHRLAFTPCSKTQDVFDIIDYIEPKEYSSCFNFALNGGVVALNNSFGYSGGQEEIIAKSLFPDEYNEIKIRQNDEDYFKCMPAAEFIKEYERQVYYYLTSVNVSYPYTPCQYILNHYISCIEYLEEKGKHVPHHKWLPTLLSCLFNFVEPRTSLDGESDVAKFVTNCIERLSKNNLPQSLRNAINGLGKNKLIEHTRAAPPNELPYFVDTTLCSDWDSPWPRVLHGLKAEEALSIYIKCAKDVGLLSENFIFPAPEYVNISSLVSDSFIEQLGSTPNSPIPAYHFTFWYQQNKKISSFSEATFGVDIFLLVQSSKKELNEHSPILIYFPRLSEHYKKHCPNETLILLERQLQREIHEQSGKYLLHYSKRKGNISEESFFKNPCVNPGYYFIKDFKSGTMELAIEGPDVEPWQGESLPPLNLENI